MTAFTRVWTDEQREAVERAVLDDKISPMRAVSERAKRGELLHDGQKLEPFDMPIATMRGLVHAARRRRAGRLASELARAPAQDQATIVRARLMSIVDHELQAIERQTRRNARPDMARASSAAKVAREAMALRNGSAMEARRGTDGRGNEETRPPAAATPALRRLAGEHVPSSSPAHPDAQHTQANEQTGEEHAHAENGAALERLYASAAPDGGALDHGGAPGEHGSGDGTAPGTHAEAPETGLAALAVRLEPILEDSSSTA